MRARNIKSHGHESEIEYYLANLTADNHEHLVVEANSVRPRWDWGDWLFGRQWAIGSREIRAFFSRPTN